MIGEKAYIITDSLLSYMREEMSWNFWDGEECLTVHSKDHWGKAVEGGWLDHRLEERDRLSVIKYKCYPGSPIIREFREALKEFDSSLKAITLEKELWGDIHHYLFAIVYRRGRELDEPIEDDGDYEEALAKLDKFMDPSIDEETQRSIDTITDLDSMKEYLDLYVIDEERMYSYLNGGSIEGFAKYLIERNKG